ncbi:C3a anaphylatoxin chemotactic receptor-like [Mercenaria mercenaria]|uniref:C3a anaphylatoxin chemotactic receptor-like n=1 Tax=Mercenaria mercenaria TaxID=6596 RepID=UPI00234E6F52|nr:C3a anaphylatoxin chemotactic receptor-like [Mercenaria mercenaria]XP_053376819.1 C3a anaphylatoxin chemotactic receptor-like [Mercenaria mercenaria]XP_053376823.1 C3a anaphylatoxin chemotactic receptor-like [Mercenaria mercenaria]
MDNEIKMEVLKIDHDKSYKNIVFVENSSTNSSTDISRDASNDEILVMLNDKAAYNLISIFVTCGILMLVGIFGNSLVVQVYWCKMKSSAKRTFILALALLDLTVCIIVIPFELYDLRNQVMFYYDGLCKAMRFVEYATILSAGFVLVSISFERYYFLCRAFQEFSPRKAKLVCLACVVLAMLVATPSTLFAGSKTRHEKYGHWNITGCECSMNSEQSFNNMFKRIYYYCLTAIFFGCFIVFIVIYTIIGRLLWKYQTGTLVPDMGKMSSRSSSPSSMFVNKKMSVEHSSGQSHASCSSNKERNTSIHGRRCIKSAGSIIIFFSVTVVFVLSFLPHIIIRLLLFFNMKLEEEFDKETSELLYNFVVRSYLISNVTNPFIYSILNKSFRRELKRTFRCFSICRPSRKGTLLPTNVRKRNDHYKCKRLKF